MSRLWRSAAAVLPLGIFFAATGGWAQADSARPAAVEADVRFMQGMIAHHAQAVTMAALVPGHSRRADMKLLAERIDVSQKDEIAMMRRWLGKRGAEVPDPSAHQHHAGGAETLMPGMLTEAELARLAQASGEAFDRMFLTFMIRHHEGALTMVAGLFATRGAAQEPEIFAFVSEVDADQRAEIKRMQALLDARP